MNLNTVADQLSARLDTIEGLRCFDYPPSSVAGAVPAAIVSYPERVDYDMNYRRAADRIEQWPILIVVGKATDRTARERIYDYAAGSGTRSVKAVLESGTYTAFGALRVRDCTFDVVTIAGVDYISALFSLDIAGPGA